MIEVSDQAIVKRWFVAIVMPAHDEECVLEFIKEIEDHLLPAVRRLHFVVVDDASTSPVAGIVARGLPGSAVASPVTVIRNDVNLGHGPSALKAYTNGLTLSPDAVIHVDGDGQFRGEDFPALLYSLVDADAVIGIRETREDPWFRRLLSRGLRRLVARDASACDVNSPLRAYRPAVVEELLASVAHDSLVPHVHWTRLHSRLGLRVAFVQVRSLPRRGASSVGSTWGPAAGHQLLPSRRLVSFVVRAALEVLHTRTPEQQGRGTVLGQLTEDLAS